MSCENCSDGPLDGVVYITYTGGPPHAPFAAMRTAVTTLAEASAGAVLRYQPTVREDGSIEYKRDTPMPPVPEGYANDERDPWILHPIWASCIYRVYRVQQLEDGSLKIEGMCMLPAAGNKPGKPITNAKCRLCKTGCAIGSIPAITGNIGELIGLDC